MKKILIVAALAVALNACSRQDAYEVPTGSDVTVQQRDGVTVEGKLIEVRADDVVLQLRDGGKREVKRSNIASLRAVPLVEERKAESETPAATSGSPGPNASDRDAADPDPARERSAPRTAVYREVTIPTGTLLKLNLNSAVGSDTSKVEDTVRATLRTPVTIDGVQVLPAGAAVTGHVTDVARPGKVKGRARIAFRFTRVDPPGAAEAIAIRTGTVSRLAPATKKRDAATIGGGAVGGAIIGGILGGGDGAAKGAAIGGAGGTGVVLATRGKEVRVAAGTPVAIKLTQPLVVRVPVQ